MLMMCVCDVCVHVHMYVIRESTCVYAYQCASGARSQLSSSVAPCLILGEQGFLWSSPIGQTTWQPLWVFVSPPPGTRTPGTRCLTRLFTRVLGVKIIAPSLLGKLTSTQPITPNPKKKILVAKIYFLLLRNMTIDFFFSNEAKNIRLTFMWKELTAPTKPHLSGEDINTQERMPGCVGLLPRDTSRHGVLV